MLNFLIARRLVALLIAGNALGIVTIISAQTTKSGTTVWDGVYTMPQAERGGAAYTQKCAQCHQGDLGGYHGVLKFDRFIEHWRETNLDSFYATMSSTMPRDNPGSLSERMNLDILAFVLRANDFPAGANELTVEGLRSVKVQEKTGPRELPTGALVDVVGCLAPGPGDTWVLTAATEPVRTRNSRNSTPEELKAGEIKPLGTHRFELMDAVYYSPQPHRGHKVEVKGLLIRNPGHDRINLITFQGTDSTCEP